jgi:tetratricopeptide (TPR) repeat protein
MKSHRIGMGFYVTALIGILFSTSAISQNIPDPACSPDAMRQDPTAAVETCTLVLANRNQTQTARAEALKTRGRAFYSLNRLDAAMQDFESAMALNPKDAELPVRAGWIALSRGQVDKVDEFAKKAFAITPAFSRAFDLIAAARYYMGRGGEALRLYDNAIAQAPDDPQPQYHRLLLFFRAGYYREALQQADQAMRLPEAAITVPRDIVFDNVYSTSYRVAIALWRGTVLERMGRIPEAGANYQKAVENDPCAMTYAALAYHNMATGAPEAIIQENVAKAISLDADYWYAHELQGQVDFHANRFEAAVGEFSRAAQLNPGRGETRWWNARALRKRGLLDQAVEEATLAVKVDPNFIYKEVDTWIEAGYLSDRAPADTQSAAVQDAARACMLDERCW